MQLQDYNVHAILHGSVLWPTMALKSVYLETISCLRQICVFAKRETEGPI